jgi:hypothetical protein
MKSRRTIRNRKIQSQKGGGIGSSKPKKKSPSPPRSPNTTKKVKSVSFSSKNEVREQSPKSEDEFYHRVPVNQQAKRIKTRKERFLQKRIRQTAKTDYKNRQREQYMLDLLRGNRI